MNDITYCSKWKDAWRQKERDILAKPVERGYGKKPDDM